MYQISIEYFNGELWHSWLLLMLVSIHFQFKNFFFFVVSNFSILTSCCHCIGFVDNMACKAHISWWNQHWGSHQFEGNKKVGCQTKGLSKFVRFWTKEKFSTIFRLDQWQVKIKIKHISLFDTVMTKLFVCFFSDTFAEHFGDISFCHQHISQKEMVWYSKQFTHCPKTIGHNTSFRWDVLF